MDNLFLTQYFDWNKPPNRRTRLLNAFLAKLGFSARVVSPYATGQQTSIEQRLNLFHLANETLRCGVSGDFVEIGTHQGSTAVVLQRVLQDQEADRRLHLFDAFLSAKSDDLRNTFQRLGLSLPNIIEGFVEKTVPANLPDSIAFAHVDVGWAQAPGLHHDILLHCLSALYPRLSTGGICVLADYCDTLAYDRQNFVLPPVVATSAFWNIHPAVKPACDQFLADKPEQITLLYSGPYSHAYFRKLGTTEEGRQQ